MIIFLVKHFYKKISGILSISEIIGMGELAALGAMFAGGLSNIFFKSQGQNISPIAINTIKISVGAIGFFIAGFIIQGVKLFTIIPLTNFLILCLALLIGFVIGDSLYLISQHHIGVSIAFPIALSYPLLTYLFSILMVNETFTWVKSIGIVIVLLGVFLISKSSSSKSNNANEYSDELQELPQKKTNKIYIFFAMGAAVCWALGTVILQIGLEDHGVIEANAIRMFFGAGILYSIFRVQEKKPLTSFQRRSIGIIILGAIIGTLIGNSLYLIAVQEIGATTTSAITASAPMVSTPLSALFLKEKISFWLIIATILTVTGIILIIS